MTAFSPGQSPPPVRMPTVLATAVLYRSTRCRRRAPAGASARVAERGDSAAATLVDPHPGPVRSLRTPVLTHTTGADSARLGLRPRDGNRYRGGDERGMRFAEADGTGCNAG